MSSTAPTRDSLKEKAKVISKFMKEKYNVDVSHGHSLELTSQLFGFKDWNTASAASKSKVNQTAFPVHIETVGDLKEALELFKETDMIDADFEFKIKDVLENLEEFDNPEDLIHQTFSLSFEGFNDDIASLKLKLENEDIYSFDEKGIVGRTLR